MEQCPANLIDQQWQVTENILDPQHRKRKSSHHVGTDRGIDGNKKIKGRKEHSKNCH